MRRDTWVSILAIATFFSWLWAGCNISSPVSIELGARCSSHDDCSGLCLAPPSYPDGLCSQNCDRNSDCPGDSVCVAEDQGICLYRCSEPADCEFLGVGWTCTLQRERSGDEVRVCVGG